MTTKLSVQIVKPSTVIMRSGTAENEVTPSIANEIILRNGYFYSPAWRGFRSYGTLTYHTDGLPYRSNNGYNNWDLSADRANATRRALIGFGVRQDQIDAVVGRAHRAGVDTLVTICTRLSEFERVRENRVRYYQERLGDEFDSRALSDTCRALSSLQP